MRVGLFEHARIQKYSQKYMPGVQETGGRSSDRRVKIKDLPRLKSGKVGTNIDWNVVARAEVPKHPTSPCWWEYHHQFVAGWYSRVCC